MKKEQRFEFLELQMWKNRKVFRSAAPGLFGVQKMWDKITKRKVEIKRETSGTLLSQKSGRHG